MGQPKDKEPSCGPDEPFPSFVRGLRSNKCLNADGSVNVAAFAPPSKSAVQRVEHGGSNHDEVSINWDDDEGAATLLARDKANSAFGIARVTFEDLKRATQVYKALPTSTKWERSATARNKYHGNILFDATADQASHRRVQTALSLWAEVIPTPKEPTEQAPIPQENIQSDVSVQPLSPARPWQPRTGFARPHDGGWLATVFSRFLGW